METRKLKLALSAGALALSMALAGCGGGGGSAAGLTDAQRMEQERQAQIGVVDMALRAANSAVQALTAMSDSNAIAAAQGMIDDAEAEIDKLPEADQAGYDAQLAAVQGHHDTAEERAMIAEEQRTAEEKAQKMADAAAAKDAKALFDGINETTSDLTVTVTAVADKHGGVASVTATGLIPGVGANDVMKSAEPMLGMWQGTKLTDTNDAGASSTVVVYTNIEAPKATDFSKVYNLNPAGHLQAADTTPKGDLDHADNRSKIMAAEFVHTGRKNHDPDSTKTDDVAKIRGTFNGANGEYRCVASSATACASHDAGKDMAGNNMVRLEGEWLFDPDVGAMAMKADDSYAYFGWWLNKGSGEGVETGAFHGATGLTQITQETVTALGGEATYTGEAAGKYALNPSLSVASGGHWTADVTLTAKWGSEDEVGMISGEIGGFMADGESMDDWKVELGEATLTDATSFTAEDSVVWTIGGREGGSAGSWSGSLYEQNDNNVPTVATGRFDADHRAGDNTIVGHMVGAFGATKQ